MKVAKHLVTLILFSAMMASCQSQQNGAAKRKTDHLCTMMGELSAPEKLVGESTLLWNKKKVQVYFFDDYGNIQDKILRIANEWLPHAGVQFVKSYNQSTSDIRISFKTGGWWSYIGNDCLSVGKDSVTMSLDSLYLYPAAKIRTIVLHEFGHSLGLLHEHQHPFLDIKWKLPELYSYYEKNYNVDSGWVNENVLTKYASLTGIYCDPDLNSVMVYEIPEGLTEDDLVVKEPLELSFYDKKYIKYMYTHRVPNDKLPCD